jgi:signal transduction histidine kinase
VKLFTRYSRASLTANIIIFLVASLAFYFALRFILIKQIDEDLQIEHDEIVDYVQKHDQLPESFSVSDQVILFTPAKEEVHPGYSWVALQQKNDEEPEEFRRLLFQVNAGGNRYMAEVSKSFEGSNSLMRSILFITVSAILVILIVSVILNRFLLKKLWKPFYLTLDAVRNFHIGKEDPMMFPSTDIEEFQLMNETLKETTQSSRIEYLSLKTFSENASHEIQTPIAVIRSKLDLLIQDEQLTEGQGSLVQSAYNSIDKLSRLNRSLLLLAKIENNQFDNREEVFLYDKVKEKILDFQDLWQSRSIAVDISLKESVVKMNQELADILLNNLFSNATGHNYNGGNISVNLAPGSLTISNTSKDPMLDPKKLFQRFYKPSFDSQQNGLGLSIIKQIADASDILLDYRYINQHHHFTLKWKNNLV